MLSSTFVSQQAPSERNFFTKESFSTARNTACVRTSTKKDKRFEDIGPRQLIVKDMTEVDEDVTRQVLSVQSSGHVEEVVDRPEDSHSDEQSNAV